MRRRTPVKKPRGACTGGTEGDRAIDLTSPAIAAMVLNLSMIAVAQEGDADAYGGITFGDAKDPFLRSMLPEVDLEWRSAPGRPSSWMFIGIVGQFFCGLAPVTANSRRIYKAFSRDGVSAGQVLAQDQRQDAHSRPTQCGSV